MTAAWSQPLTYENLGYWGRLGGLQGLGNIVFSYGFVLDREARIFFGALWDRVFRLGHVSGSLLLGFFVLLLFC
jgi:hypothetical protein